MAYTLPVLGSLDSSTQGEAVSYLDGLVLESVTRRLPLEPMTDRNLNLFLGRHWETSAPNDFVERIVVNRIQNAIMSMVAVQMEQPPRIKFTPRESTEPPIYFINTQVEASPTPDMLTLLRMLPPEVLEPWPD